MNRYSILHGRVEDRVAGMSQAYDAVLCDPPYGLRFMSKRWDYDVPPVETWRAIMGRVRPGGFMLAFGGSRTFHRLAVAIEDAGWEIRDTIIWMHGGGFPKGLNVSKAIDARLGAVREIGPVGPVRAKMLVDQQEACATVGPPATTAAKQFAGYGTALKPAYEPILVCMRPLDGTFAANAMKHGVAGINIDASRVRVVGHRPLLASSPSGGRPGNALTGSVDGSLINGFRVVGTTTQGRFPANVILDAEAGEMLDAQAGKRGGYDKRANFTLGNRPGGFANVGHGKGSAAPNAPVYGDAGGTSRFFYCPKACRRDRGPDNNHPTVKPHNLCRYPAKMLLPPPRNDGQPRRLLVPAPRCSGASQPGGTASWGSR